MTSATDELRRLLTERGVVWNGSNSPTTRQTTWNRGPHGIGARYLETVCSSIMPWDDLKKEGPVLRIFDCTPDQAVDATLGRGTCKDVGIPGDFACSACGARMFTENNDGHTMCLADKMTIIESPNYCPNCGAKVVS